METESQNEQHLHYAVVGGGIFGASTALALKREFPDARISLFKGTHASTASRDINKIIRMAYPDEDYVKFAGQAMKRWETESPYREFYYRTSWVQVRGEDGNGNIHRGPKDKKISTDELLRITGSREEPILGAGEELWLNEDIGYVDSDLALEAVIREASGLGVVLEEKSVTRLIIDERGACQGVEVGGHAVTAEETIVAAGAWTPGLLKKSNIRLFEDENKARNFFNITAVGVATLALGDEEFEQLKSMPILVTNRGEVMPSKKHQVLKMTTTHTFSIDHPDKLGERDFDIGQIGMYSRRCFLNLLVESYRHMFVRTSSPLTSILWWTGHRTIKVFILLLGDPTIRTNFYQILAAWSFAIYVGRRISCLRGGDWKDRQKEYLSIRAWSQKPDRSL